MEHQPVLVDKVVELLLPALVEGGVVIDATLGRAGHARRILDAAPAAELVGIDRDPEAVEASRALLASYGDRVRLVRGNFQDLAPVLERLGGAPVRGVLFDLGVSSPQLDDPRRGFGFRAPGPLDMRMDPAQELTAHAVVNRYLERDLERTIARLGEERFARRIARAIVRARPLETTDELAETVRAAIPAATRRSGGHPARRTFQAIRIEVNGELHALEGALGVATDALAPQGRAVVISYHSLEDRIVKSHFAERARGCTCPPELPVCRCDAEATMRVLTRRPIRPDEAELGRNARSRAGKLRAAERLSPTPEQPA
ncbi:16S rRNA (cytosine(1402)-N(4))-methyltransferase RsmH [soil metagenome]